MIADRIDRAHFGMSLISSVAIFIYSQRPHTHTHTLGCTLSPTEVVRTRLRQRVARDQRKYHSFVQTLVTVWREEGLRRGLYGGMSAHLIRVVPNTAIVFLTYEAVVNLISHYHPE